MSELVLVAGAGGFIGGHLVKELITRGYRVRAVDSKMQHHWWQRFPEADNWYCELSKLGECNVAARDCRYVFNVAAEMGGVGYIESHKTECMLNVLINTHLLMTAHANKVERYFFASSRCIYPDSKQADPAGIPLREEDAYPADPHDGYGWEKLFSERMCRHFREEKKLATTVLRYHPVYGPCFDSETEILTTDGFKKFPDITRDDMVATLNPTTQHIEYQRPSAIQNYDYSGPMHRVQNKRIDLLVTPDHSVYMATKNSRGEYPFRLCKMKDADEYSVFHFKRGGRWDGTPQNHFDLPTVNGSDGRRLDKKNGREKKIPTKLWMQFLGWYLSEGYYYKGHRGNYFVGVSQKSAKTRKEIAWLFTSMGYNPNTERKDVKVSSKQLYQFVEQFGKAHDKYIPRNVLSLPKEDLKVLLDTLHRGDGTKGKGIYSSVSKRLAEDVQELAIKVGYGVRIVSEKMKSGGTIYRVHYSKKILHSVARHHRSVIPQWSGRVYDVTVPNHIIMVRRNGKTVWSGNCCDYDGGKEKAPAAICRKVAQAKVSGNHEIEIWGDGKSSRSFMWIGDCVKGTLDATFNGVAGPLNLGSTELVSIDDLVTMVEGFAGIKCERKYNLSAPRGVVGCNSDNTAFRNLLGWEPSTPLQIGMEQLYAWVYNQVAGRK